MQSSHTLLSRQPVRPRSFKPRWSQMRCHPGLKKQPELSAVQGTRYLWKLLLNPEQAWPQVPGYHHSRSFSTWQWSFPRTSRLLPKPIRERARARQPWRPGPNRMVQAGRHAPWTQASVQPQTVWADRKIIVSSSGYQSWGIHVIDPNACDQSVTIL
jgi:hypothetical protein